MHLDDSEILHLISRGATFDKGFNALVDKYQKPLYWHVRRMVNIHEDADDVIQNVFIKVYKSIKNFRADAKLYTWLYKIASNESISFIRKRKQSVDIDTTHMQDLRDDPFFTGDEIQLILKKAIEELPEKQKQVFVMRYYDELPYKELSRILEKTEGALKASYHHAVKKIELYLKNYDAAIR